IAANGGAGSLAGGGGGGGCIAITSGTNNFTGLISAFGGNGFVRGGAGTGVLKTASPPLRQNTLHNHGKSGASSIVSGSVPTDLTLQGGAVGFISPLSQPIPTLRNLLIKSNAFLLLSSSTLLGASNATVQAGGGIITDGTGSPSGQGAGSGK